MPASCNFVGRGKIFEQVLKSFQSWLWLWHWAGQVPLTCFWDLPASKMEAHLNHRTLRVSTLSNDAGDARVAPKVAVERRSQLLIERNEMANWNGKSGQDGNGHRKDAALLCCAWQRRPVAPIKMAFDFVVGRERARARAREATRQGGDKYLSRSWHLSTRTLA